MDRDREEEADSQALSASSPLEERMQHKTGVDAGFHYALPLGLGMQLG